MDAPPAPGPPLDLAAATAQLADAGLDIVHPFDAAIAAHEPGWERLATADRRPARLGIVIGNTRALWPRFVAARARGALAGARDPLERYTEDAIAAAYPGARVYFAHQRYDGAFLPFQRLAVAVGLGALAPTQLVIHPICGPWFALRAVVVTDGVPPPRAPIAPPCTCTAACRTALDAARGSTAWQAWLAVRDACELRAWRYSDDQIRYHYTRAWPGTAA